jgi:hypothetical protein
MANEEGIKISITAEDRFTDTIKKIEASTKIFGETAKNTEKYLAALEKEMIRLVANGMDPANKKIVEMKANYDKLNQSLNNGEGALKQSNKQWTALSLVVQDLPFGFRGIQNNLPALLGSIAGVGGAAYFAFSAIVALYTAYGQQINDAILKTTDLEKAQKELSKATVEASKSTETARTELLKVTSVVQAAKDGFIDKTAALQYYNEKLGDSFGKVKTLEEAEQALVDKAPKYIEALMLKAKAEFYFAKASEFAAKKDIASLQDQTSALDKLLITANTIAKFADVTGVKSIIKTLVEGVGQAQREGVDKVQKTAGAIADVLTAEGKKSMTAYFAALKDSGLTDTDIQAIVDKLNQKLLKTTQKADAEKLKAIEKANNAEIKAFVTSLDERAKKEYEAGLALAENLQVMRDAGYTDSKTYYTAYRAEMDKIAAYYNNKEIEEAKKTGEKIARDAEIIDNRNLQNSLDSLKIESDVAMKIANLSGKANANDRIKILEDYKNSLYELASTGGYTAEQFDKIDDAIKRVDGAIEGSKDRIKDYSVTWQETANSINSTLTNLVRDSIAKFAENIGKALGGEKVDVFGGFLELLAGGLQEVGKALIAYGIAMDAFKKAFSNPYAAIAAGIALVAAGALLKSSISRTSGGSSGAPVGNIPAFANGGIISGPTMGLMGEYPGAKSNPEVVAPLDKLKDMLGGGQSGTFLLRGQDLLLSVNRAQKASNLKGQTISLA